MISPSGANIDCTINLCLFFSLGSNLRKTIDFDSLNLNQDLLKGLETDCDLDLVVWVHYSRVRLHAILLGSCCLDLEADLV